MNIAAYVEEIAKGLSSFGYNFASITQAHYAQALLANPALVRLVEYNIKAEIVIDFVKRTVRKLHKNHYTVTEGETVKAILSNPALDTLIQLGQEDEKEKEK